MAALRLNQLDDNLCGFPVFFLSNGSICGENNELEV